MRHEMLTQRACFRIGTMAGHAESAFCEACRTSSTSLTIFMHSISNSLLNFLGDPGGVYIRDDLYLY